MQKRGVFMMHQEEMPAMSYPHEPLLDGLTPRLHSLAATLRREAAINQAIAEADPLGADGAVLRLPGLNERIAEHGVFHQPNTEWQNDLPAEAGWKLAVENDDASAGTKHLPSMTKHRAMMRHGFSEALLALSADVAAQIPRDSFIDYTSRNPGNERERTFTSLPQERVFIDSLRRGMSSLDSCLANMLTACTFPISRQEFATCLHATTASFQMMIDSIVQVKRGITPEVFTHHIRPFFEPFRVGDRAFSAPSGAEMPIAPDVAALSTGAGGVR